MKKMIAVMLGTIFLTGGTVYADEVYVTKAGLEAEGKLPYSVNYKYQEDYIAGKAVPESAVYFEPMTTREELIAAGKEPDSVAEKYRAAYLADELIPVSSLYYKAAEAAAATVSQEAPAQDYILNWNGEYDGDNGIVNVVQNGRDFTVTVTTKPKTVKDYDAASLFLNQLDIASRYSYGSAAYNRATTNNVLNNLYGTYKEEKIPAKTLFTKKAELGADGSTIWLYPGSGYQAKLSFEVIGQKDMGDYISVTKRVTISDNTSSLGKNPFTPDGKGLNGTYTVITQKYK